MHTDTIDHDTAERIVDAYLASWNEHDPAIRAAVLTGIDAAHVRDGRIASLYGFFEG